MQFSTAPKQMPGKPGAMNYKELNLWLLRVPLVISILTSTSSFFTSLVRSSVCVAPAGFIICVLHCLLFVAVVLCHKIVFTTGQKIMPILLIVINLIGFDTENIPD